MNLDVMADGSEQIHYQDPAVPIYITYGKLKELSDMAALCHWHEDVELLLPFRGYLSYNVNGRQLHIAEGNAIFINSRQMHYGFSSDGTDSEYICICFKPDLLCCHKGLYDQYVMPILTNSGLPCLLLEKENPEHTPVLDIIRSIADCEERNLALMGKLLELWQRIYDLAEPVRCISTDDANLRTLRQMIGWIHTQYAEHISLTQIADAGGVCRSKCCQIFKKYMGLTPNDYLTSFRLERAAELLGTTNLMVTEIAFHCGFNSSSYFAEVFTRKKGCSPKEYRRKHLQSEPHYGCKV